MMMTTYSLVSANLNNQRHTPPQDYTRHIASLKRSVADLEAAGLPSDFYRKALAALEGLKGEVK